MKTTLKVSLKANERIYVNGAVIRVDRKTSMEFLNDVSFLMENHVLQPNDADTPIRKLYYLIQLLLIGPADRTAVFGLYRSHLIALIGAPAHSASAAELKNIDRLVHENCLFEAMRNIRKNFASEFKTAVRPQPNPCGIGAAYFAARPQKTIDAASPRQKV